MSVCCACMGVWQCVCRVVCVLYAKEGHAHAYILPFSSCPPCSLPPSCQSSGSAPAAAPAPAPPARQQGNKGRKGRHADEEEEGEEEEEEEGEGGGRRRGHKAADRVEQVANEERVPVLPSRIRLVGGRGA